MDQMRTIKRALISVSDKQGIAALAQTLIAHDIELISTGGTAKLLNDAGISVIDIEDYTQFPEMMDGRVKTLHPKIYGGLLARRDLAHHLEAMVQHDFKDIDLVIVNLYPFEETVAAGGDFDQSVEQIDIGGPTMVRAAAKNHQFVNIITDPSQYAELSKMLDQDQGRTSLIQRRKWAAAAFALSARYEQAIASWFLQQQDQAQNTSQNTSQDINPRLTLAYALKNALRYGENPHQQAALYQEIQPAAKSNNSEFGITNATLIQGKQPSYNNYADGDAAFELVREFDQAAVAIIKHANPCGVAISDAPDHAPAIAWEHALAADPVSAFGGVVAVNREIDAALAAEMIKLFLEVIIAPSISQAAIEIFKGKPNLRVMVTGFIGASNPQDKHYKSLSGGGLLVQAVDDGNISKDQLKLVTDRAPNDADLNHLLMAWRVCKHVKSNAIVLVGGTGNAIHTIGIGAGQMSRVEAAGIAISKAESMLGTNIKGLVAASDAFFPFADSIELLAKAGIKSVIQPGGAMRDSEVIAAANHHNIAMAFTNMRHFKH
ncbi:MAG: bifunctional phosphoribosylaminoimidazolecarboxamide formyltransferase/IMP cyclohydrolase [Alphaproteobacteria bacterium]